MTYTCYTRPLLSNPLRVKVHSLLHYHIRGIPVKYERYWKLSGIQLVHTNEQLTHIKWAELKYTFTADRVLYPRYYVVPLEEINLNVPQTLLYILLHDVHYSFSMTATGSSLPLVVKVLVCVCTYFEGVWTEESSNIIFLTNSERHTLFRFLNCGNKKSVASSRKYSQFSFANRNMVLRIAKVMKF